MIPLFTIKITTTLVKQAMESIRFIDVISWTESIFGSSMLSQRRNLKSANISDTERLMLLLMKMLSIGLIIVDCFLTLFR